MSRIKYPKQEIINSQIEEILNRSGLFNDEEYEQEIETMAGNKYVQCVPVKDKKSKVIFKVISCVAAAAAIVVMLIAMRSYQPVSKSTPQALNTVSDDTQNNSTFRNSMITYTSNRTSYTANEFKSEYDSAGQISVSYPTVKYNNNTVESIENHYKSLISDINNQLKLSYYTYDNGSKLLSERCSLMAEVLDAGISNENIVSLTEVTQLSVERLDIPITTTEFYAYSYDVTTGEQISLYDIFTDTSEGIIQLKLRLRETLKQQSDGTYTNYTMEDQIERSVVDGSWFLGQYGLSIAVNNYYSISINSDGTPIETDTYRVFTIPYEKLYYLRDEYR